jgi:hypothetical protein
MLINLPILLRHVSLSECAIGHYSVKIVTFLTIF